LPGASLVRANRRPTSALIKLDLPTFDRPTSAISDNPSLGNDWDPAALTTNSAAILKVKRKKAKGKSEGEKYYFLLSFYLLPFAFYL